MHQLYDELFMSFHVHPWLSPDQLLAVNKDEGKTILTQAAMIKDSEELIIAILKKYPLCYRELDNCKLIHYQKNFFKNTPLHWAIANSSITSALTLLDENLFTDRDDMVSQINAIDYQGKTPLMIAIAKGPSHQCNLFGGATQSLIIDRLLELSADVTIQNNDGQTALHFAAAHRDIELVKKLILAGGNLIQPDKNGNTPLHMSNLTEEQADAYFKNSADPFTREVARWRHDETKFRDILNNLAGEDTTAFVPININFPVYKPIIKSTAEKEYEKNFVYKKNQEAIARGMQFCAEQRTNDKNTEQISKSEYSIFPTKSLIKKSEITTNDHDITKDNTNNLGSNPKLT